MNKANVVKKPSLKWNKPNNKESVMNKRDYTGKAIFVGIDVHKKTYSVAVVCDKVLVKRDSLPACPDQLITYLNKFFAGARIKSAYEAGFSGYILHRALVEAGVKNIVVHAASIEIGARDRVKNDKRDAQKIAVQLEACRLEGIYIPTLEEEDRQELTRHRDGLVKNRSRIGAQMKLKAMKYGLVGPADTMRVSQKWIDQLMSNPMGKGLRYVLEDLKKQWQKYTDDIKAIGEELKKQAQEDIECETVYRSFAGIGPIAARILSNELGNMKRFSSAKN